MARVGLSSLKILSALFVGVIGMLMAFHPMILSGFERIQTDLGDTRLVNYILEHGYLWATGDLRIKGLFDPSFFYPAEKVAGFTELLLGVMPFYWLWRALGLMPDSSFQAWMLTMGALNYAVAVLFFRRAIGLTWIGTLGASFLFAFGSPRVVQMGHQQLLGQFYSLLFVWSGIRWLGGARGPWIAIFWLSAVLQLYSSFYLGWFLFLGSALVLALLRLKPERWAHFRAHLRWKEHALWALVGLVLLFPMIRVHLHGARELGLRHWGDVCAMLPRPHSWLLMGQESWLYFWQSSLSWFRSVPHLESRMWTTGIPMLHEHQIGVGLVTLTFAFAGMTFVKRDRWRGMLLPFCLVLMLATTAWFHYRVTPWHLPFYLFPGANGIRALTRVIFLLLIPFSIGLGLMLGRLKPAWATVALAIVILEQGRTTDSYSKIEARESVRRVADRIPADCRSFLYAPPKSDAPIGVHFIQVDAMWAGLSRGIPTVNGLSGGEPKGWVFQQIFTDSEEHASRIGASAEGWIKSRSGDSEGFCLVR